MQPVISVCRLTPVHRAGAFGSASDGAQFIVSVNHKQTLTRIASKIIGLSTPTLTDLNNNKPTTTLAVSISNDHDHLLHHLLKFMPSGQRYRSKKVSFSRSFEPQTALPVKASGFCRGLISLVSFHIVFGPLYYILLVVVLNRPMESRPFKAIAFPIQLYQGVCGTLLT